MTVNATTLRIERLVAASAESLFRAWTTRDAMETWYRDRPDDVVRVVALDVRVGGHYRVEFGPSGEPPYVESGQYREIDAPHRIVMSESLDGPDGTLWSDTTVTVTLTAEGGKTRLVLLHERFPTPDARDGAASGWPGFLDRIEQVATAQPSR